MYLICNFAFIRLTINNYAVFYVKEHFRNDKKIAQSCALKILESLELRLNRIA